MRRYYWMMMAILILTLPVMAGASDPMRPPEGLGAVTHQKSVEQPQWRLQSVLVSEQRHIAVINQRAVTVGDSVNGARVLAIHPGYVRLSRADEVFVISLPSLKVKRPANGQ